jgi:hypothetical protein
MYGNASADIWKGVPADQVDLIPAAQLAAGSVGSTASAIIWHPDTITGGDDRGAPYTWALRLDGLILPWRKGGA